ncbi:MAG: SDR family NAD(P)-dependent oxidoreductase [Clostridia bacterium]|nr:SDR family NAD(P)-dependent oxidoreductase [Clostridia bacterium]
MIVWMTGASSGLGLHTAKALSDMGHTVLAGARSFPADSNAPKKDDDGILRHALDVTDDGSVDAFCRWALSVSPAVDAIVHCAGILVLGPSEETSVEEYLHVMDTDFLGMVRMNQRVLPVMRAQGHGRIIMFSSINGLLGIPFQSAYTAAKHAVEGYAECLQMEVEPFGIQVCLVEPGDHRSGSSRCRLHVEEREDSPYREACLKGTGVIARDENGGSDPEILGRKVGKLLSRHRMPFRKRIASADQHLAVVLHDVLPPRLNNLILTKYYTGGKKTEGRA